MGTGPAGSVFGVNSSYRETWDTRRIATCLNVVLTPSSGTSRASQEKFKDGTVLGLYKGPVDTGPAGSVFWENSVYLGEI